MIHTDEKVKWCCGFVPPYRDILCLAQRTHVSRIIWHPSRRHTRLSRRRSSPITFSRPKHKKRKDRINSNTAEDARGDDRTCLVYQSFTISRQRRTVCPSRYNRVTRFTCAGATRCTRTSEPVLSMTVCERVRCATDSTQTRPNSIRPLPQAQPNADHVPSSACKSR